MRTDKGVFEMVRRLVRGTFKTGGDAVFDLRGGYVGLGRINKKVPPRFCGGSTAFMTRSSPARSKCPAPSY